MPTTELTPAGLQNVLTFSVSLARRAGEIILAGSDAIRAAPADEVNEKKNSVDLVTEYDVRVEELVKGELKTAYPSYQL
jgi:myo-inositol-1(or 4)-monophosphatase